MCLRVHIGPRLLQPLPKSAQSCLQSSDSQQRHKRSSSLLPLPALPAEATPSNWFPWWKTVSASPPARRSNPNVSHNSKTVQSSVVPTMRRKPVHLSSIPSLHSDSNPVVKATVDRKRKTRLSDWGTVLTLPLTGHLGFGQVTFGL